MCAHGSWPLARASTRVPAGSVTCLSRHLPLTWSCMGIICSFVLILPIEWKNANPRWLVKVVTLEERIGSGVCAPPGHAFSLCTSRGAVCAGYAQVTLVELRRSYCTGCKPHRRTKPPKHPNQNTTTNRRGKQPVAQLVWPWKPHEKR